MHKNITAYFCLMNSSSIAMSAASVAAILVLAYQQHYPNVQTIAPSPKEPGAADFSYAQPVKGSRGTAYEYFDNTAAGRSRTVVVVPQVTPAERGQVPTITAAATTGQGQQPIGLSKDPLLPFFGVRLHLLDIFPDT